MSQETSNGDNQTSNKSTDESKESITNVKAEFNRKFDNLNKVITEQWQDMQSILTTIAATKQQPAVNKAPAKPLKDLVYEGDEAFDEAIESRIASSVEKRLTTQNDKTTKLNSAIADVAAKFPEFSNASSEAYQAALKKHLSLPEHIRGTPEGVKIAMLETVAELGLLPVSKRERSSDSDDFSLSGKGSSKKSGKRGAELEEATIAWADAFGIKHNDEKVKERLKKYSAREWLKYE